MGHNPNQTLMGNVGSSAKEITNRKGSIEAGLAVRLKSDGTITTAKADGELLGISVGQDLSFTDKTAICRKGLRVPVKLATSFNPVIGAQVHLSDTTGEAMASGAGATGVNATYVSGRLSAGGLKEGTLEAVGAALVDFPGGL